MLYIQQKQRKTIATDFRITPQNAEQARAQQETQEKQKQKSLILFWS